MILFTIKIYWIVNNMVVYRFGRIFNYKYWGCFQDISTFEIVLNAIREILYGYPPKHIYTKGKYIFAFDLNGKLVIVKNGYYGVIIKNTGMKIFRNTVEIHKFRKALIILGTEYLDDLPKYEISENFCRKIERAYSAKCFIIC